MKYFDHNNTECLIMFKGFFLGFSNYHTCIIKTTDNIQLDRVIKIKIMDG